MKAAHLKPDKYMKNDKDQFKELKVRGACPAPPSVWAHAWVGISTGEIKSGESHLGASHLVAHGSQRRPIASGYVDTAPYVRLHLSAGDHICWRLHLRYNLGRLHLYLHREIREWTDMMADGCYAAQGVDEHAALQGPQVRRAQLGQLDDVLFERRAHLLQQIRAHGVRQDAWCAPRRTRHDLGGHTTISTNEPMPCYEDTTLWSRVIYTLDLNGGSLRRASTTISPTRSLCTPHSCPSKVPERYA